MGTFGSSGFGSKPGKQVQAGKKKKKMPKTPKKSAYKKGKS